MPEVRLTSGTIRYEDVGSGPPVVFVHGLLVNGTLWRDLVGLLAGRARCIVPDWPYGSHEIPLDRGADRTPTGQADLIAEFLAALDLSGVTLVGNDSGGALAQIVATRHPERLGRLVLTPCDCFSNFLPPMFKGLQVAAKVPGLLTTATQPLRLRALQRAPFAYGWLAKRPIAGDLLDEWSGRFFANRGVRRDVIGLLGSISSRYTLDAAAALSAFDRPTLIAWAPEDRFFPLDHAERLARIIPDARLETIEDSRTFVALDQPQRTAQLIGDFVTS
jgi:pimeloyl-ACP methyl ester carboxylesterase